MDTHLFLEMLGIDSTSGKEGELADMMAGRLSGPGRRVETFEVGDGTRNVLVSWGEPEVFFCTHLDTVPPYIPPYSVTVPSAKLTYFSAEDRHCAEKATENKEDGEIMFRGRGTCDAKGQIAAMYGACAELERRGRTGFALLLLAGEETGSFGAKAFSQQHPGGDWVIVGEPTDNCMVSASKGTKAFEVEFCGKPFHSGYPQHGVSAVMMFNDFVNALRDTDFPDDDILGDTTWNIGRLVSDNPQNILSDSLVCRIYFRTTFESDGMIAEIMDRIAEDVAAKYSLCVASDRDGGSRCHNTPEPAGGKHAGIAVKVKCLGGDVPSRCETFPGFKTKPVAFGSDAPHLNRFRHKALCGPGTILVAHTADEYIMLGDIEEAARNYVKMFEHICGEAGQKR